MEAHCSSCQPVGISPETPIDMSINTTEKSWGETSPLYNDLYVEMSRIVVHQGGYSSRHKHLHKDNAFLVVRGRLLLICYDNNRIMEQVLTPCDGICTIAKGVEHRFKALDENTVAYEFYYVEQGRAIDCSDIVRCDSGGIAHDLNQKQLRTHETTKDG